MKELKIEAKLENLDAVLEFIDAELAGKNCSTNVQHQIAIAVEEIFVNIAHYAYNPLIGEAVIRAAVGDEITIEFEDRGKSYNPLEKDDPDITAPMEKRDIGGLGIFMTKKIMDTVEYRHKNNKNIFVIKKELL
jgi:anti-sigma regulatory factor (Ser/Thr protein kinase)